MKPPSIDGGESPAPGSLRVPPEGDKWRVAVTSSGSASPVLRIVTVALIGVSGFALYLTRATLAPVLDRVAPVLARAAEEEPVAEPEEPEAIAEPTQEEPSGPQLTYEEIETMLIPLPERLSALIGEGRSELPEFSELSSSDEFQARRIRSRWQNWGRIWGNRVGVVEGEMPPAEECRIHASLEPTCTMLEEAVEILRALPSAERIDEAREHLDRAAAVIEDFLRAAEEAAAEEAAELGEDAADESQE
ncbi:MAG: hypothetical protein GY856_25655 [bacterium]|nr:hypothetical protein [bacterium]